MFYLLRALAPAPLRFLRAEVHPSTLGKQTPAWISAHYAAGPASIPVKLDMAFEAPLSEWHVSLAGERFLGDVDVFRDIYLRLPNDGLHTQRASLDIAFPLPPPSLTAEEPSVRRKATT